MFTRLKKIFARVNLRLFLHFGYENLMTIYNPFIRLSRQLKTTIFPLQ